MILLDKTVITLIGRQPQRHQGSAHKKKKNTNVPRSAVLMCNGVITNTAVQKTFIKETRRKHSDSFISVLSRE